MPIGLVVILAFTGFSMFWTYSMYRIDSDNVTKLTQQYNEISEELSILRDASNETKNKFVVLSWHEQIGFMWDKWVNVSSYEVGYLYYNTEAGSGSANLVLIFPGAPSSVQNVIPGTLQSSLNVQIGAPNSGVLKFDIQGQQMYIELNSIESTPYDWIRTSLSLYLVG